MAKTFKDSKESKEAKKLSSKKPKMEPYSKTCRSNRGLKNNYGN